MAAFFTSGETYRRFRVDLDGRVESAGFFLAAYDPAERAFRLREWRAITSDGFESRSEFHLVLKDDIRAEIIKWAWDAGASLVEAHSHDLGVASFSPSDIYGLEQWVPHLWWRLRGRPYGAIVVDGGTLDALAWIEGAEKPEQVVSLAIYGQGSITATGRTLAELPKRVRRIHER